MICLCNHPNMVMFTILEWYLPACATSFLLLAVHITYSHAFGILVQDLAISNTCAAIQKLSWSGMMTFVNLFSEITKYVGGLGPRKEMMLLSG